MISYCCQAASTWCWCIAAFSPSICANNATLLLSWVRHSPDGCTEVGASVAEPSSYFYFSTDTDTGACCKQYKLPLTHTPPSIKLLPALGHTLPSLLPPISSGQFFTNNNYSLKLTAPLAVLPICESQQAADIGGPAHYCTLLKEIIISQWTAAVTIYSTWLCLPPPPLPTTAECKPPPPHPHLSTYVVVVFWVRKG